MNKYIVFLSLIGFKSFSCTPKSEFFKKKNESKKNKKLQQKDLTNKINELFEDLKNNSKKSFDKDYKFLVVKFMQSPFFNREFSNISNKKNQAFLKNNKDFGRISSDFKINDKPDFKVSFPLIPMVESLLNVEKNEVEFDFLNKIAYNLSEFLNKAYELRVKKWALLNIESDIEQCYSALSKIKNSLDFAGLNEKIDDLFEEINDLKQDINDLESEMESRWNIEKSFWSSSNFYPSFEFVFSFLQEDMSFALKNTAASFKKDKKFNLSFVSVDFNLKVYPDIKPSFSVSLKLFDLIFGNSFEDKNSLDISLKNSFEISKVRRNIKKNIRKASKNIKKHMFLKQKTSKTVDFDKENLKKKIEDRLKYIRQCLECCSDLVLVFEQIVLYKKINNDLILDCKMLLGEEA
ncbi:hypothetical protein [Alphaproteobacteria bacterium endosymbiont of Tiliacea citrago]|uniref:hypothetical protein n=1 Tax=Alphaproteobacteria bacterium endosymbiont of Tiliacea citrago TaxID=3077944 RepID=UPI00313B5FB7